MSRFVREYLSWIVLFLSSNLLLNVLFQLDAGFSRVSIVYFNVLQWSMFILFCIWRYQRDRQIIEQLEHQMLTPLKREIAEHYIEQLQEVRAELSTLKWQTAEQQDRILAWVHDMKSPLTAMKLMIDQIEQPSRKNKLEQEWFRIYLLLDQQLYLTRLQTIEQDSRLEKVVLRDVVYREIKTFQSWCIEKGIGVEVADLNEVVITDAKWLAFIVRQYISNAVKYSKQNSYIHITTGYTSQGNLLLKVEDTGVGISTHDLPRVFNKSYTGSTGRETSTASGMGLYLAKQAADTIGLKLYIQSQQEEGTISYIQFPLENEYIKRIGM